MDPPNWFPFVVSFTPPKPPTAVTDFFGVAEWELLNLGKVVLAEEKCVLLKKICDHWLVFSKWKVILTLTKKPIPKKFQSFAPTDCSQVFEDSRWIEIGPDW